jgi:DNA adenine methylase
LPVTDSPLRYPGGKTQMKKFVFDIMQNLPFKSNMTYVEPFAGGSGVALSLLFNNQVSRIHINDLDPAIYKFWFSILNHTEEFISLINETQINISQWRYQKEIQKNKDQYSDLEVGFSTFFLNRTNVSGIINGGPIGGKEQNGKYKLDCRFNKKNLIRKINRISELKEKILISNDDAAQFIVNDISNMDPNKTFIFFDPPYYKQGQNLYANFYTHDDHLNISNLITSLKEHYWITTYDYSSEIEKMYPSQYKKVYSLNYSANNVRKAHELLFYSPKLTLPESEHIVYIS